MVRLGEFRSAGTRTNTSRYHIVRHVSFGRRADETFLLNRKTGKYYKLDDVGSELWTLLRQPIDMPAILRELSAIYEMPPEALDADVTRVIDALVHYGMIEVAAADNEVPRPSLAWCFVQLIWIKVSLMIFGFGRTVRWYRQQATAATAIAANDPVVEQIVHRVSAAASLFPGRAFCLERSLILHRELRRRGVDSRVRFGVFPYPFFAHAWVEVGGRPISEIDENMDMLTPLDE
jgi:Transglutaminase-like superfamily/Coenzyme PQQ synthesis protein D (PqqD)